MLQETKISCINKRFRIVIRYYNYEHLYTYMSYSQNVLAKCTELKEEVNSYRIIFTDLNTLLLTVTRSMKYDTIAY